MNCIGKILVMSLCLCCALVQNVFAIGGWVGGAVTKAPWHEKGHLRISIGKTQYTIMPNTEVKLVRTVNKVTDKVPMEVSALRVGDMVSALAEGNRIYLIEKSR